MYYLLYNHYIVVVDAHLQSVTGMFWEESKKVLITCSEDQSVKMCQFPVYWPSEMIREKQENKKAINNSMGSIFGFNDKSSFQEEPIYTFRQEEKDNRKDRPLNESEIWSDDIDGWSTE